MNSLPADCPARIISTRSRGIFAYQLDASKWEWHEQTATDHGVDLVIELSENGCFSGRKIEGQLKGTTKVKKLNNGEISFDLDVKTVNFALNCAYAYVLFLVDVTMEEVYYTVVQEYFILNPSKFEQAKNNTSSVAIHFDPQRTLNNQGDKLELVAKYTYVNGPGTELKRV